MSHELSILANGDATIAYSSHATPWHGLGQAMDGLSTVDQILAASHSDYTVEKHPAFDRNPDTGEFVESSDTFFTKRRRPIVIDDQGMIAGGDWQTLGTVGSTYSVIQNRTAAEFALAVLDAEGQARFDTAGTIEDGRTFFSYIALPDTVLDPNGVADRHSKGLAIVTSHDGSRALTLMVTRTRVVCKNTVNAALRSGTKVSIRHSKSADQTMAEVRKSLGLVTKSDAAFEEIATQLLGRPATFGLVERVADKLWDFNPSDASDRKTASRDRRIAKLDQLWKADTNAGGFGHNGWAAFNTLTEYMDHHGRGDNETLLTRAALGGAEKTKAASLILAG